MSRGGSSQTIESEEITIMKNNNARTLAALPVKTSLRAGRKEQNQK